VESYISNEPRVWVIFPEKEYWYDWIWVLML
jgi:hypothetical protein